MHSSDADKKVEKTNLNTTLSANITATNGTGDPLPALRELSPAFRAAARHALFRKGKPSASPQRPRRRPARRATRSNKLKSRLFRFGCANRSSLSLEAEAYLFERNAEAVLATELHRPLSAARAISETAATKHKEFHFAPSAASDRSPKGTFCRLWDLDRQSSEPFAPCGRQA